MIPLLALLARGVVLVAVAAGLAGAALPLVPSEAGELAGSIGSAFLRLAMSPGLGTALLLSVTTGFAATGLATILTLALWAFSAERPGAGALAPLLAVPHAATAIGLAFLLGAGGWIARLTSPELTGWTRPPGWSVVQDPSGMGLILGLVVKEVPFLLLVALAAPMPAGLEARYAVARSLGRDRLGASILVGLPALWPQLRLPVAAVLAYGLTGVDMALVLGPTTPPLLAPMILGWAYDPSPERQALAGAGALLLLLVIATSLVAWRALESLVRRLGHAWLSMAARPPGLTLGVALGAGLAALSLLTGVAAVATLVIWSIAGPWTFPDDLPAGLTLASWLAAGPILARTVPATLLLALGATAAALALCLLLLIEEGRARASRPWHAVLYLPLVLPQLGLMIGVTALLVRLGLDGAFATVALAHLLFTLPYGHLVLRGPWLALDARLLHQARSLGHGRAGLLLRVELPLLRRAMATAAAVCFAVSFGLYLPTLLIGGGRVATITTETLAGVAGADRRVSAVLGLAQAALPLAAFAVAALVPPPLPIGTRRRPRPLPTRFAIDPA